MARHFEAFRQVVTYFVSDSRRLLAAYTLAVGLLFSVVYMLMPPSVARRPTVFVDENTSAQMDAIHQLHETECSLWEQEGRFRTFAELAPKLSQQTRNALNYKAMTATIEPAGRNKYTTTLDLSCGWDDRDLYLQP